MKKNRLNNHLTKFHIVITHLKSFEIVNVPLISVCLELRPTLIHRAADQKLQEIAFAVALSWDARTKIFQTHASSFSNPSQFVG